MCMWSSKATCGFSPLLLSHLWLISYVIYSVHLHSAFPWPQAMPKAAYNMREKSSKKRSNGTIKIIKQSQKARKNIKSPFRKLSFYKQSKTTQSWSQAGLLREDKAFSIAPTSWASVFLPIRFERPSKNPGGLPSYGQQLLERLQPRLALVYSCFPELN